ncbi:hypothetical protein Tco_0917451, partial [Tanacetum coccineum]
MDFNVVFILSKGSIIINGSPTDEFQFGRGLKQGDPLSPFLFLLIMESLHISFQRVVDAGMFQLSVDVGVFVNLIAHVSFKYWRSLREVNSCIGDKREFEVKKASWVKWKKAIFAPKDNGGLAYAFGVALLSGLYTSQGKIAEISGINLNALRLYSDDVWCEFVGKLKNRFPERMLSETHQNKLPLLISWSWTIEEQFCGYTVGLRQETMIDSRLLSERYLKRRWIRYVPNKVNTFAWK